MTKELSEDTSFKLSIKTLGSIVGGVVIIVSGYFGIMSSIDSKFAKLESQVEKALELPAPGTGNYTVDMGDPAASQTWPPSRPEFNMKDQLSRSKIETIERDIIEIKNRLNRLESR